MKAIELTIDQRKKLIDGLADVHDEEGVFEVEIEVGENITVNAVGNIETDGYREDEYFNGTGAWVETYRSAWVELTATVYDDDDSADCCVDTASRREAEAYLAANINR